ncbi:hypothetical protein PPYR_07671 [Photinus pyralis]|uniref:Nuclear pore complex protein Nup98-Nup96 n=1 Tax=Photinus pyralis TaxID=7054 RepID=A0A5N4AR42_PHOPY|nr:nuclear pore complex protein Nup98-Nup96 [Photinus pyralis]KAB0799791.1 hypothetical protein PPYR_07671 [Photinus pyralis]
MFSNLNKSAFGTTNTAPTFGFGSTTTNQTPFGQSQFSGKPNTGGFGQSAPLFGSNPQPATGTLFSNPTIPAFAGGTQQTGFGTGLFGQQPNVGVSSGTNGLFTSSATSTFGQQNKASFGFAPSTSTLFGQQQPQNFQAAGTGGVFGGTSFGATPQAGTVIKFNPTTGTDTMQKGGVTHSINTKHHCITCMKEYESKSLEELQWEDYQANRKGPQQQQQSGFGSTLFGTAASTAPSLFGQTDTAKAAFGQTSAFGTNTSGFNLGNQAAQPSLFGKTSTGFGTTPTTNAFNFNATTSTFGSTAINKGFGTQPTANIFGSTATTQPSINFGTSSLFQNTAPNTGLFSKATTQPAFSTQQPLFNFNQQPTTQSSIFQTPKSSTGFGTFGTSNVTTPAFGQQSTLFSSQPNQNPFNVQKPAQTTFGQPLQTGFGLGTQTGGTSLFGQNKPLLGGTTQPSFFNTANTGFMMNQQQPLLNQSSGFDLQPTQDFYEHVQQIYGPFQHHDFLVDALKSKAHNTTDPKALKEILDQAPMPLTNIEKNTSKYRTIIKPKSMFSSSNMGGKYALLDDVMEKPIVTNFSTKPTAGRRLILRKSVPKSEQEVLEDYKRLGDGFNPKNYKSIFSMQLNDTDVEKNDLLEKSKLMFKRDGINGPIFNKKQDTEVTAATPVRESVDKIRAKQLPLDVSNYLNATDNDISAISKESDHLQRDNSYGDRTRSILQDETSPKDKVSKTVRFQDNEVSSSSDSSTRDASTNTANDNTVGEEEKENNNAIISTHLSCGVKLTRPEYYTKPPLNELHKYKNEKGECIVKGFTIGHNRFGSVYFPDAMDVSNLNLDEIVDIDHRDITVYADDDKKPPIGQGLNRRAQITMENVWPRDKHTQKPVYNVEEIAKTNFIDRLRLLSKKQNTTFLDYRPETGTWKFTVDHFSKYCYEESDCKKSSIII